VTFSRHSPIYSKCSPNFKNVLLLVFQHMDGYRTVQLPPSAFSASTFSSIHRLSSSRHRIHLCAKAFVTCRTGRSLHPQRSSGGMPVHLAALHPLLDSSIQPRRFPGPHEIALLQRSDKGSTTNGSSFLGHGPPTAPQFDLICHAR
jgi:hypothetical protein